MLGHGRIIVTTSTAATKTSPAVGTPYLAAKAAIAHLVRQLALELARFNITVNAIQPGPFQTRITTPELLPLFEQSSPSHRVRWIDGYGAMTYKLAVPHTKQMTPTSRPSMARPRTQSIKLPPHVHCVRVKGRPYYYFAKNQRDGAAQRAHQIANDPRTPEWWDEYRRLMQLSAP